MKEEERVNNLKEIVSEILKQHKIKIEIGGCGCCGSPWFSFEHDGNLMVDDETDFNLNMFEDK